MHDPVRSDDADVFAMLGGTLDRVGDSEPVREASARMQVMIDAARGKPGPRIDPRTLPARFTRLKAFAQSAAHYELACQERDWDTLAIRIGSGTHAALFENRPLVCYEGRRAGKAWDRFEKHHLERRAVILNEKEYAIAAGMVSAIQRHPRAMEILFDGTEREQVIEWSIGDRACQSTPDSCTKKRNSDLKSSRCTEPRWLARECLKRYYHAQLAFYDDALAHKNGVRPDEDYLVCVENVAPFNVVIFRLPDATREAGIKLCRLWWEQLLLAEATNRYRGYVETEVDLELPDYETGAPLTVEIDGELVEVG